MSTLNMHAIATDSAFTFLASMGSTSTPPIPDFITLNVMTPILLWEKGAGRYTLLDGHQRYAHAKASNWVSIPAQVLPADTPKDLIWKLAIHAHRLSLSASVVRQSKALTHLKSQGLSRADLKRDVMPLLGLRGQDPILRDCLRISELPEPLLHYIEDKQFGLKQATSLTYFDAALVAAFTPYLSTFKPSAQNLILLLENLSDLCTREDTEPANMMATPWFVGIAASQQSPGQKMQALKEVLQHRVLPSLKSANDTIAALQNTLPLPKGSQVVWDRTLEDKGVTLSLRIKRPEDIQTAASTLNKSDTYQGLTAILAQF